MIDETSASDPSKQGSGLRPELQLRRIYLKDVSYESPHTPRIFASGPAWNPDINLQLNTETTPQGENVYEVVLTIHVTAKVEDKTAFLVELKQAGIFLLKGFERDQLGAMLGSYCPNVLFPYAREAVSNLVTKGGFPQLLLAPINFDALYAQHLEKLKGSVPAPPTEQ